MVFANMTQGPGIDRVCCLEPLPTSG